MLEDAVAMKLADILTVGARAADEASEVDFMAANCSSV